MYTNRVEASLQLNGFGKFYTIKIHWQHEYSGI